MWIKVFFTALLLFVSAMGAHAQRNTDVPLGPAVPLPTQSTKQPAISAPADKGAASPKDSSGNKNGAPSDSAGGANKGNGSSRGK
jgi:hypothetical protein